MPTLQNASGRNFIPDLASALKDTVTGFEREEAKDLARQQRSDITSLTNQLADLEQDPGANTRRPGQIAREKRALQIRLARLDPKLAETIERIETSGDERMRKLVADKALRGAQKANNILEAEDKQAALQAAIDDGIANNEDVSQMMEMRSLGDDELVTKLQAMKARAETTAQIFAVDKLTTFKSDQGLANQEGKIIREPSPGLQMDFKSKDREMFTGESMDLAGRTGKASDLKFRPEFIAAEKAKTEKSGQFKFAGMIPIKGPDGRVRAKITSLNSKTGKPEVKEVEITGEGESVADRRFGLTADQDTSKKVKDTRLMTRAELEEKFIAEGKSRGQARDFASMEAAVNAADNIPEFQQTLDLLGKITTGGTDAIKIKALRAAGLEGADLGELTFNLRKNVLKQLKPTFGAAFTEREGKLLAEIEANESKSTDANIRLIQRALERANRFMERGRRAAERQGDKAILEDIEIALEPLQKLSNRPLAANRARVKKKEAGTQKKRLKFNPKTRSLE